jgi:cysteine-rich repeat protein
MGQAGEGGSGGAAAVCGDGIRQDGEECDDGDQDDTDGCTSACEVVCPKVPGAVVNPENGHCYWPLKGGVLGRSWLEQHQRCKSAGGYLVSVRSGSERDFLKKLLPGEFWIGATDGRPANEPGVGTYFWISKEPFDYSSWAQGEPNAFAFGCPPVVATCYEHCAVQRPDGLWNDKSCNDNNDAICEWTPPGTP